MFPCGFSANVAVAAVLAADDDVHVFSDELNHASIIDGLRLATRGKKGASGNGTGPRMFVYRHSDMRHLQHLLATSNAQRKLVITDSLFSMDGDFAPITDLLALRREHGFLLVVDDAHATLVCDRSSKSRLAESSRGVASRLAQDASQVALLCKQADVVVGTMSKAMGSQGGFVCASSEMRSALINLGRPLIYSTALAAPCVAAASAAIHISQEDASINDVLWERVAQFSEMSGITAHSPIIPIILGPEARALEASQQLLMGGMHVPAIRPPTVQPGTSRLRLALSAAHSEQDVVQLVSLLCDTKVLDQAAAATTSLRDVARGGGGNMQAQAL